MVRQRHIERLTKYRQELMELLEPRLLLSTTYPDLQDIVAPDDDPTLPAAMDDFSPPTDAQTPDSDAPILSGVTFVGDAGDVLALTGDMHWIRVRL